MARGGFHEYLMQRVRLKHDGVCRTRGITNSLGWQSRNALYRVDRMALASMPAALQGKWANAVIVRHIVVVALEYIEFVCMRLECLHLFYP